SYPEWDFRRTAYRDPGVVLRELPVPDSDCAWVSRALERQGPLLASLRRQFLALRPRLERLPRQIEGDEIDVDAWVGEYADRLAGQSPPGQLYCVPRRRRRDLAVALLVDASGSTDAWISGNSRVIDVAKEAALCLSEALCAVGDRHAIYAFSGHGPGDVRVWVAKSFVQPLAAARARIGALEPDRATRLGGPIRHVTAALARVPAQTRILLVLSDGKPNDDDGYEGDYGVEDVRQAVHEAAAAGVRPFCVTIDRHGSSYLPRLFGPSGYTLLWDASQLPERLPQIYRHLTRGVSA
ncbi:MAG: nitric oxide reductase activation protein NorD, partial [Myxococcota bacterium]